MPIRDAGFELKFDGDLVQQLGGAPASAVAAALDAVQRLAHLIGMQHEGRTLDRRARPPASVQERYLVLCEASRPGSHVEPFRIVSSVPDLVATQSAERAGAELSDFFEAIEQRDAIALVATAPDPTYRRFMLAAVDAMSPPPGGGLALDVLSDGGARRFRTQDARSFVSERLRAPPSVEEDAVLTGSLEEIDFTGRRMTLLEVSTRRKLTCSYDEVVEPMLLEHARELIQVFGSVVLDAQQRPESIQDVRLVEALDRSSFHIDRFVSEDTLVLIDPPLDAPVEFDREMLLLTATCPDLGVDAYGETRAMLESSLRDELDVLWRSYANAADEELAPDARALKSRLNARFKAASTRAA